MPPFSLTPTILFFGRTEFKDGEEYLKFRYRFTCAILLFSAAITLLFHIAVHFEQTKFDLVYLNVSRAFLALSILYYFLLRGHPSRLGFIATSYAIAATLLHVATLLLNTPDELRIIWFALNLPGIYLVLGSRAGILATLFSIAAVIAANPLLPQPYSVDALFTCVLGILYLSVLFHVFAAKSVSFHHAMVDANRKLADLAAKDPLTGLYNARAFYGLCEGAWRQARRTHASFAMLFVDLDHFKKINDNHGHEAGDTVLKEVAATILLAVRQSDVVGRIGGEEFSALLPDTDIDGAAKLAEKLRQDIEALMPDIGTTRLRVTASIGVAAADAANPAQTIAEIQHQADQAMYVAKREGRNRVTCVNRPEPAYRIVEQQTG